MSVIEIAGLDLKFEASSILERMAYKGEQVYQSDMRKAAEHYTKRYETEGGLPQGTFDGLIAAYEYVRDNLVYDEAELNLLYDATDDDERPLASLVVAVDEALVEAGRDRDDIASVLELVGTFLQEDVSDTADITRICDMAGLVELLSRVHLRDKFKWLCIDVCTHWASYRDRTNALIGKAEALLREKRELLLPYEKLCLDFLREKRENGTLVENLGELGLNLKNESLKFVPNIMCFASVQLTSNVVQAGWLGIPETVTFYYGALVNEIESAKRNREDSAEKVLSDLHALDDKNRLAMLVAIRERPMYANELAKLTGLSPATVSHHMSELISNNFVALEKQGVKIQYSFDPDGVAAMVKRLEGVLLPDDA